jgi:hypothetical protein
VKGPFRAGEENLSGDRQEKEMEGLLMDTETAEQQTLVGQPLRRLAAA